MSRAFAEISFTPSVLAVQELNGSAESYAKFLEPDADRGDRVGPMEAEFISRRDGFYQATVSNPDGLMCSSEADQSAFSKCLMIALLPTLTFRGNRQYLSCGNLADNDRVSLILMDYPNRRRLKVWGRAKLVGAKDDPLLMTKLQDPTIVRCRNARGHCGRSPRLELPAAYPPTHDAGRVGTATETGSRRDRAAQSRKRKTEIRAWSESLISVSKRSDQMLLRQPSPRKEDTTCPDSLTSIIGASLIALSIAAPLAVINTGLCSWIPMPSFSLQQVVYRSETIDGIKIAYREAGNPSRPTILSAAWISDLVAHVPQPHSKAGKELSCDRTGLSRLWCVRHAARPKTSNIPSPRLPE